MSPLFALSSCIVHFRKIPTVPAHSFFLSFFPACLNPFQKWLIFRSIFHGGQLRNSNTTITKAENIWCSRRKRAWHITYDYILFIQFCCFICLISLIYLFFCLCVCDLQVYTWVLGLVYGQAPYKEFWFIMWLSIVPLRNPSMFLTVAFV